MRKVFCRASPETLFILGLVTLPAFLFQEKLLYRVLDAILFLIVAMYSGKKIRPLPGLLLLISVTAAALFVPYGKVLFNIFGLPVTEGALKMGVSRGILLLGLLYLSKFTVVQGLAFPGRQGNGIAKVFFYFERFSENSAKISLKDLPGSLDNLLLSVSVSQNNQVNPSLERAGQHNLPLVFPLAVSLACWSFLFL